MTDEQLIDIILKGLEPYTRCGINVKAGILKPLGIKYDNTQYDKVIHFLIVNNRVKEGVKTIPNDDWLIINPFSIKEFIFKNEITFGENKGIIQQGNNNQSTFIDTSLLTATTTNVNNEPIPQPNKKETILSKIISFVIKFWWAALVPIGVAIIIKLINIK